MLDAEEQHLLWQHAVQVQSHHSDLEGALLYTLKMQQSIAERLVQCSTAPL